MKYTDLLIQLLENGENGQDVLLKLIEGLPNSYSDDDKYYGFLNLDLESQLRYDNRESFMNALGKGLKDVFIPSGIVLLTRTVRTKFEDSSQKILFDAIRNEQEVLELHNKELRKLCEDDTNEIMKNEDYYFEDYVNRNKVYIESEVENRKVMNISIDFGKQIVSGLEFKQRIEAAFNIEKSTSSFGVKKLEYINVPQGQIVYLMQKEKDRNCLLELIKKFKELEYSKEEIDKILKIIHENDYGYPEFVSSKYTYAHYHV
jgi:hypothetical protein